MCLKDYVFHLKEKMFIMYIVPAVFTLGWKSFQNIVGQKLTFGIFICLSLCFRGLFYFSSVQPLSPVWLFATLWTAAHQASLSITNSWNLLKLMSIKSVMLSNHLILCCPLLFLPVCNLSQHQGLFKLVSLSHQVAKVLEFQLQHQSFQWTCRTDLL